MPIEQSKNNSVLIIEDEPEIRKFLRASLSAYNFKTLEAETAADGIKLFTLNHPDIILLDLGLPDMDGIDVIKNLREWTQTPVIVLSARGKEEDKIKALELGADDYLTKPFGTGELMARIKVALRHSQKSEQNGSAIFEMEGLKVDLASRMVTLNENEIHLTPIEYKLLSILVKYGGKVITHKQLMKEVWGRYSSEDNNNLRIHMQHLRQKIGDNALNPKFIITEPGVGYRFRTV